MIKEQIKNYKGNDLGKRNKQQNRDYIFKYHLPPAFIKELDKCPAVIDKPGQVIYR